MTNLNQNNEAQHMQETQQDEGRSSTPQDMPETEVRVNVRGKSDPAWGHIILKKDGATCVYTCFHCGITRRGGGINRMKQHLAGRPGQIHPCKKVPHDVRHRMEQSLLAIEQKKKNEDINEAFGDAINDEEGHQTDVCPTTAPASTQNRGKRKAEVPISGYFATRTTAGSQPSLQSVLASKENIHQAKMAIGRWFFDACIPFYAIQSPYFQEALTAIASIGPGFKGPSYDELRINLLGDCKRECQFLVESHRANWASFGCTIMADGWSDQRQRTLINFMVSCPTGMSFVKSVDASDVVKDASTLCNMFCEVIKWVGPQNVVHVVTDNAANYVAVGRLIHEKYENIFWTPCAAHCLNLLLKDIGSMTHIADLASKASKVTKFIYNHMIFLIWLRKRNGWKEIVRPGVTRFATTFITLKSIADHQFDLQALVVDKHFACHRLAKTPAGKRVHEIILDNKFWKDCVVVTRLVAPIIRLLKIVDGDEKPSMGYVYEGMQRTKNAMKEMFKNKSILYKPYTDIIKARWDKHLKRTLHAAAYFLNPAFFYDPRFNEKDRVVQGLLDLLEVKSICPNFSKALQEMNLYRERKGSFGRGSALKVLNDIQPAQWWSLYGGSAPLLQKIAIRLLGQTSSSSGCERNWSFFERIHTKKRNRLEHQRLSDHVYVTYNLRLRNRGKVKKRTYDPIDYQSIDNVDFWVVEEEAPPEFDANDIDIYQENAIPVFGEPRNVSGDEEIDILEHPLVDSVDIQIGANVVGSSANLDASSFDGFDFNLNDVDDL